MINTRVKVKVCGFTQKEQALVASHLDIDAMGFILYPKSKRFIDYSAAAEIVKDLPPFLTTVGVVVNETLDDVINIQKKTGVDVIQLHGDETPEFCQELNQTGIRWLKAIRVRDDFDFSTLDHFPTHQFLLDAWSDQEYGGTGEAFDWSKIQTLSESKEIILAGGIRPDNAKQAVDLTKPYAIDVSSGVEVSAGVKSMDKIQQLLTAIS
ncbi:MAG: phosphoribosylanthranilate isomerase [bacterium]|jgi:phosphoribosylanthranilate isomerase